MKCLIAVALGLAPVAVHAQRPAFDAASVKLSPQGGPVRVGGGPGTSDPGQFSCANWSLSNLLMKAYNIRSYQLSGPSWLQTTGYDVVAKIPASATADQFRTMLQALLEERLKLALHRENREMAVYELVLAKGGPKLQEVQQAAPPAPTKDNLDKDGFPIVPGGSGSRVFNGRARIQFRAQTMPNLANLLTGSVGRPVLDATGLEGKYAFTLSYYEPSTSAPPPPPGAAVPEMDSGPTIFKAIQDQLGLKLEPKKSMVEMLVVDRAEKVPIEN
jgi:uncharacterized protein (TIGR03435 family)